MSSVFDDGILINWTAYAGLRDLAIEDRRLLLLIVTNGDTLRDIVTINRSAVFRILSGFYLGTHDCACDGFISFAKGTGEQGFLLRSS